MIDYGEVVSMSAVMDVADVDVLAGWVDRKQAAATKARNRRSRAPAGGIRFAFYGRISTEDFQDRESSRRWQQDCATDLIAGHGSIVAEFFDVGCSRRWAWADRPYAGALLAAVENPDRGFDAIVVGEYERAFYGDQLLQMAPLLRQHGVQLWLPELGGPVDAENPTHQAVITLLGYQSKREVLRARFRTTVAMQAQAREQGRHLGRRPPYGYRLVDAGPHPNRAHARWGRRLHRLEPDLATAPHVKWIFVQRLAGRSVASIARMLNEKGVPCPSRVDRERNPHRSGEAWTLRTVAAILANPRYTGRQVWNRQRTDRDPAEAVDDQQRYTEVHRWNQAQDWVISKKVVHPPLVGEEDFVAAQAINAVPTPEDGSKRTYLLVGLIRCQLCGRLMDSHWVHRRPGYRCRHGHTSATTSDRDRLKNIYVREDIAIASVAAQLGHTSRDPWDIAAYLRAHGITIMCGVGTVTLEVSKVAPVHDPVAVVPRQRLTAITPPKRVHQA
ncbi:recombinase family protein [Micromonospora sp. NBC_00898]|uniref:recombinase family protein n=1 Tax=Micromonospora sp. NBC_00898 TaxID=2975981 RepID=UPI00386B7E4F|nr:recombinase family protein [Micromonospora sp. NBC_00898]